MAEASKQAVVLITSVPSTTAIECNQRYLSDLLAARGIAVETMDGANAENKDARTAMWAVSGKRGLYPQLFARDSSGAYTFIGDWETIERMNEENEISHALDTALAGLKRK